MSQKILSTPRWVIPIVSVVVTLSVLGYSSIFPAYINSWERKAYDQRLKWVDKKSPHPDIVLIGRDSESERQLGYGIWDRAVFARMIEVLGKAGASVIALDFAFVGSSPAERGGVASDEQLAQAVKRMGNVVLPLPVQLGRVSPAVQIGRKPPTLDHFTNALTPSFNEAALDHLSKASLLGAIQPELLASTHYWGHIASISDDDGVFRRVPTFLRAEGHAVPAFGVAIAAHYLKVRSEDISLEPGKNITINVATDTGGKTSALAIPIDAKNNMLVNYAGDWDRAPFTYLLFSDVMDAAQEGRLHELTHWVEGKIVLILHAGAEHDKRRTPLELRAPGGFIHANVVHTILTHSFLLDASFLARLLILLLLSMVSVACIVYLPWRIGWIGVAILMGNYTLVSQIALTSSGRIYPLVLPLLGSVGSSVLAYAWTIWEGKQRIRNLELTLEHSQHKLQQAREDLARTESMVEQFEEDLEASRTEVSTAKANQQTAIQRIQELETKLHTAETELHTSYQDVSRLKKDLEFSQTQSRPPEDALEDTENILALTTKLNDAETRLRAAETDMTQLRAELQISRKDVRIAEEHQKLALQNVHTLKADLHEAETKLQTSQEEVTRFQKVHSPSRPAHTRPVTLSDRELDELRRECADHKIFTNDPGLLNQYKDLKKIAKTPMSILILGEPGTGKELFARAVHTLSERTGKFVGTNMAAIPQHIFEDQWFGHVKGAFTDAKQDQKGFFDEAYQGTIFLDEIGDLQLDMQAKLLRAIETKTITPLGTTRSKAIDVRIVAATNKNLLTGVEEGWFRRDLYDRLLGFTLNLPPLRERKADLELLAQRIIQKAGNTIDRKNVQLSVDAMESIKRWAWPGNIRELEKTLTLTVWLADSEQLQAEDLRIDHSTQAQEEKQTHVPEATRDVSGDQALLHCLCQNKFDMQSTAKAVGWERSTVTQRLKGLCFQTLVDHHFDRSTAADVLAQGDPVTARIAEQKINKYYDHLLRIIAESHTLEEAITLCRQRFKNLPDRYLPALDALVRHNFTRYGESK
ncbi:MAG: hypothetical protein NPIRA02_02620 [Nitrospirales bacterium]|nr:MAG: hypothetical protein NPIRA02_02620 [Nitrospirales bacterium]